jgi:hypothetical protein
MSSREDADRMLDRYLQGDSTLSKIYQGTTSGTPSAALDAAILAKARAAAEERALMRRKRALQRWMIPASLAAALALTVGLVTFMSEHGGAPLAPEQPIGQRQQPAELSAPEAPLPQQGEATRQPQKSSFDEQVPRKQADTLRSDVVTPESGSSQALQPATSAPVQPNLLKGEARHEQPQIEKTGKTDQRVPAGAAAEPASSPQEWLRQIAELRKQGRLNEAQASLAEFRRRYPDYPVETILK